MTTTATVAKAKAVVSIKVDADGVTTMVATKPTLNKLLDAWAVCETLSKVPQLREGAMAAADAVSKLLTECGGDTMHPNTK